MNKIACGHGHSYVRTECGKHYLFGDNNNGECLKIIVEDDYDNVKRPHRIDQIINQTCKEI